MSQEMKLALVIGVLLVFAILVFGLLEIQVFGRLSEIQNSVNSMKTLVENQNVSMKNQFTTYDSQLAAINEQINALKNQNAPLSGQLTTVNSQITSLGTQLTAANNQVITLKTQLTTIESQFSSLKDQILVLTQNITALDQRNRNFQSQLDTANSQVETLKTQVNNLQNLQTTAGQSQSTQTLLFSGLPVTVTGGQQVAVNSFNSQTAGYLYISGTTSSQNAYLRLNNSVYAGNVIYPFSGTTVTIPIQPTGYNTLYFGTNDAAGTSATATLNAYVNYSSGASNQTTVANAKYFSIAGGTTTNLAIFTAPYQGSIYVSGTTSTSSGYLRVYNPSYGFSSNIPFTSSSLATIPVQVGENTVIFGSSDGSGVTVTGSLSITYNH